MENQIIINIPEGKKAIQGIDKDGNIIVKFADVFRSKSWKEFCENHPYATGEFYFRVNGGIHKVASTDEIAKRSNWCGCMASEEDAEGIIALIQLTRLHDEWVGDWKKSIGEHCYGIRQLDGDVSVYRYRQTYSLLSFPTSEMATEFFNCFKGLIERAKKFI